MNRWGAILATLIAIFAVRAGFFPNERWWTIWGIIVVVCSVLLSRYDKFREERAARAMEEDTNVAHFYGGLGLAFVIGTIWGYFHKLGGWCWGLGAASLIFMLLCFFFALMAMSDEKQQTDAQ